VISLYPGSFDPVTLAHEDIYRQASDTLGTVIPVIASNPGKTGGLLSQSGRAEAWEMVLCSDDPSPVILPDGASIFSLAEQLGATTIVRGLRGPGDFEPERAYREFIKRNAPRINVAYFVSSPAHADVSSTAVRQILTLSGSDHFLAGYLDTAVIGYLRTLGLTKF
jgi:pantetheine-phosphate adenylyltransferase